MTNSWTHASKNAATAIGILLIAALMIGFGAPGFARQSAEAGQNVNLEIDLTVLLEGALEQDPLMRTDLRDLQLIPTDDPYEPGAETFGGPTENATGPDRAVDWVRIEIRDPGDPISVLGAVSAIVQADGDIVASSNNGALKIKVPTRPSYHAVVLHKSHLPISSPDLVVSGNTLSFDFTTSATTPWPGFHQIQPFNDGRYAMIAGNAILDTANITLDDYDINPLDEIAWQNANGQFGQYLAPDFDMNGDVNGFDNVLVQGRNGFFSSVPF